jgi:HSP20 family protein
MSSLERWRQRSSVAPLGNALDRLFEDAVTSDPWGGARRSAIPIDLWETDEAFMLQASLPGLSAEDIHITIIDNQVTLRAEVKADESIADDQYVLRERRYGLLAREVILPTSVNSDEVEAEYEQGVLTLTMPKAEEERAKSIKVRSVS